MSDEIAPEDLDVASVCEGGNLDCGSGLLLLIRRSMQEVPAGLTLEIRSTERSVREDLPAWCRMTENPYLGWSEGGETLRFFVRRGGEDEQASEEEQVQRARDHRWTCRVAWSGGLQTTVYARNHSWQVGQPASFDVSDEAPSAVEHLLGALGSCLAMGYQVHASRRGVRIDQLEISLTGEIDNILVFLGLESDGHPGFRRITGTCYVQSEAGEAALEEIWRHTVAASPLVNTLVRSVEVEVGHRGIA
ncbi:MAG: OsmC family protein [Thermoleophilaceae bacterium]|nr:OsmC family protein [Thermoleophilaceae bacterium]